MIGKEDNGDGRRRQDERRLQREREELYLERRLYCHDDYCPACQRIHVWPAPPDCRGRN